MQNTQLHLLFRKDSTLRERATAALANLQRNSYAMGTLRARIESRMSFILKGSGNTDEYQELARVLELVKNGELILNELSGKVEAARFLEEFVAIIDGAAESVSEIKGDVEQLVPLAETAIAEMSDALSKISGSIYTEPGLEHAEIQQRIIDEATAAAEARVPEKAEPEEKQVELA